MADQFVLALPSVQPELRAKVYVQATYASMSDNSFALGLFFISVALANAMLVIFCVSLVFSHNIGDVIGIIVCGLFAVPLSVCFFLRRRIRRQPFKGIVAFSGSHKLAFNNFVANKGIGYLSSDLKLVWFGAIEWLHDHIEQNKTLAASEYNHSLANSFSSVAASQQLLMTHIWEDYQYYHPILHANHWLIPTEEMRSATEAMTVAVQESLALTKQCMVLHVQKHRSPNHTMILENEMRRVSDTIEAYNQLMPNGRELEAAPENPDLMENRIRGGVIVEEEVERAKAILEEDDVLDEMLDELVQQLVNDEESDDDRPDGA